MASNISGFIYLECSLNDKVFRFLNFNNFSDWFDWLGIEAERDLRISWNRQGANKSTVNIHTSRFCLTNLFEINFINNI